MTLKDILLTNLPLVLFSAKVTLVWIGTNYSYPANPIADSSGGTTAVLPISKIWLIAVIVKSILLSLLVSWFAGWHFSVWLFTLVVAVMLPLARMKTKTKYLAELEIGTCFFYLVVVTTVAGFTPQSLTDSVWFALSVRQVAALFYIASIVVFVLQGGTYIVRGILDKGKTFPGHASIRTDIPDGRASEPMLAVNEYSRGRIIGNIERLMLMAFVALQAYQALAFLITAKGLFRSKDLEHADSAEYFLIGTLISSMIAVVAGLSVQVVLKLLW